MAIESVSSATIVGTLDPNSKAVLNTVFTDTTNSTIINTPLVAGTLLTGTGSGGTVQGAIIGNNSGGPVLTGITMSGSSTHVTVPGGSNTVFAYETVPTTLTGGQAQQSIQDLAVKNYGTTILGGSGTVGVTDNGLGLATNLIFSGGLGGGQTVSGGTGLNVIYAGVGNDTVIGGTGNSIVNLNHSSSSNIDVLANTGSKAMSFTSNAATVVGTGHSTIVAGSQSGVVMVSDKGNNLLVGNTGNDTLFASGGSDTLMGGGGNDLFVFNAIGHYTLTDFNASADKLVFNLPGVAAAGALTPWITSTANVNGNAVLNFGTEASITVVGVSVDQLLSLLNGSNFIAF